MGKRISGILLFILFHAGVSADNDNHPEFIIGVNQKIIPDLTPTDSNLALKLIDKDFGEFAKLRVSHINYDNLVEMQKDFEKGVINFIILPSIEMINNFSNEKLGSGLTITNRGQYLNTLLVVARKNEQIQSFSDLKGRKISIPEKDELSDIYLKTLSYRAGIRDKCFFSSIDKQPTSQRLILQLFFKHTDAVIIFHDQLQLALEMNPVLAKSFIILDRYEGIPRAVGYFNKHVDNRVQEYIISNLLKFQHSVKGKQLLLLFKTDEFRRTNWMQMKLLIKLYKEYKLLKNNTANMEGC